MWQYYYTIRDEFCQPLLYTKFKKKEVDHEYFLPLIERKAAEKVAE